MQPLSRSRPFGSAGDAACPNDARDAQWAEKDWGEQQGGVGNVVQDVKIMQRDPEGLEEEVPALQSGRLGGTVA